MGSDASSLQRRGTEPLSEPGLMWMRGSTKWHCDRTPGVYADLVTIDYKRVRRPIYPQEKSMAYHPVAVTLATPPAASL